MRRRSPQGRSTPIAASQGGFTLLEAIVSIALVSVVILGLSAGLLASVRGSQAAKETQETDGALSAYAESFKSSYPTTIPPSGCPTAFAGSAPAGLVSAEVLTVDHWDRTTRQWGACPSGGSDTQRLTVEVDAGYGRSRAQVVVRKP